MKRRKDGRYEKSIVINGKRNVFYGKTQREVIEKIMQFEEEREAGPLLKEVIEMWQNKQEKKISYTTMKTYKARLKKIEERFGDQRIRLITSRSINAYISSLVECGFSYKTVTGHLSLINMVFRSAVIDGLIETSPAELIRVPSGLTRIARELPSDSDTRKIIESHHLPFGMFAYLILYTGLRKGEALALAYQDIDWSKKEIHVTKSIYFENNQPKLKSPKTQRGNRIVPLLDALADVLPKRDIGLIFPGADNAHMTASQYEKAWNSFAEKTGISCTAHQLRHSMATILYEAEIPEKDAQEIMGHADITTTRNIYTHIRNSRKKETSDKLNQFISSSDFRHISDSADGKAT